MGLYDASGQLEKARRQLLSAWNLAKESWSDIKTTGFEERYIVTLDQDTRMAVETMTRMGTVLEQIRSECSDRETL